MERAREERGKNKNNAFLSLTKESENKNNQTQKFPLFFPLFLLAEKSKFIFSQKIKIKIFLPMKRISRILYVFVFLGNYFEIAKIAKITTEPQKLPSKLLISSQKVYKPRKKMFTKIIPCLSSHFPPWLLRFVSKERERENGAKFQERKKVSSSRTVVNRREKTNEVTFFTWKGKLYSTLLLILLLVILA